MSKHIVRVGQKFGKLVILSEFSQNRQFYAVCKCDCGNTHVVMERWLVTGHSKSCGCLRFESKNLAEKNGMWRGDKVKLAQLHDWITIRFPKPKLCERCKKKPPYDLANKGIYNRELKNWEWLCRRCHMITDGRIIKNLKQYAKTNNLSKMFNKRNNQI
jgi:hypothetical protein